MGHVGRALRVHVGPASGDLEAVKLELQELQGTFDGAVDVGDQFGEVRLGAAAAR
jgi:hypothetical protein